MVPISGPAGARFEDVNTKPAFLIETEEVHPMEVAKEAEGLRCANADEIPLLVTFGTHPPVAVFEHRNKTYIHQVQDPVLFQKLESQKVQKRACAKAKKERRELMVQARTLLKRSTMAEVRGDVHTAQRLRVQANNRRASHATLLPGTSTPAQSTSIPPVEHTEVELLEALEAVSNDLHRQMVHARHASSPHPLRNYRRKYRKVQQLHQQVSARIAWSTVPEEDWSLDVRDLSHRVFAPPLMVEPPYDLFPNGWAYEPAKIKELVRHTIIREYWKRRRSNKHPRLSRSTTVVDNSTPIQPTGWVSCLHTSTNDGTPPINSNRFAPLQPQEPASQSESMREEIRRLQEQVAQLGRRLQDTSESSSARFRSGTDRRTPSHRPQHERQTLAPRRWSSPPTHRGHMAPPLRRNTWARYPNPTSFPREDSRRRPYDASQVGWLPPAPTSPRREVLTIGRREGRAPTSTPQPDRPVESRLAPF